MPPTRRQKRQKRRTYKGRRGGAYALGRAAMAAAALGSRPANTYKNAHAVNVYRGMPATVNMYRGVPSAANTYRGVPSAVNVYRNVPPAAILYNEVPPPVNESPTNKKFTNAQGKLVTWAQTQRYKNVWLNGVSKGIMTPTPPPPSGNVDLCADDAPLCEGHKGIPRAFMPQINKEDIPSFIKFALEHDGISSTNTTMRPSELKPSQREISATGVKGLAPKVNSGSILESGPLIVSRDGYVVDGHHRWGAFMNRAPNTPIPVIIMNATIQEVLESAAAWGARTVAFGDAK
jgi:hypothetical protein